MCDLLSEGGRRCPSHTDPDCIKAYNAVRRARYALKTSKGKSNTSLLEQKLELAKENMVAVRKEKELEHQKESSTTQIKEKKKAPATGKKKPIAKKKVSPTAKKKTKPTETSNEDIVNKLNYSIEDTGQNKIENNKEVTKTPPPVRKDLGGEDCVLKDIRNYGLEPRKVDRDPDEEKYKEGYLAEESIHGYVRYDLLDSESHKAFGFDGKDIYNHNSMYKTSSLREWSQEELSKLDSEEVKSLQFFTSNEYEWFNDVLYENNKLINSKSAKFHHNVKHLDSAMAKAPKKQRILYRGVRKYSDMFKGQSIHEWVDNNMKIGEGVSFKGYQSSSPDRNSALSYSHHNHGLVYEILTPEGINITDKSHYTTEHEVVLPRDSKYIVAGVQKSQNGGACVQLVAVNNNGEVLDGTNSDEPRSIDYVEEKPPKGSSAYKGTKPPSKVKVAPKKVPKKTGTTAKKKTTKDKSTGDVPIF